MNTLSLEDLASLYRPVSPVARDKMLDRVDKHGRAFIALSPFCLMSSAGPDGSMDVSPRGGSPGFVQVSDDGATVFLPDRPGNNRLDTIRNLLAGSGQVGLLFMIPGFEDIYRVNGRATASADADLVARFVEFGKPPRLVLAVAVQEALLHCPKAVMRARLWEADAQVDRSRLPTLSEMIFEQLNLGAPPISEADVQASNQRYL